MRYAVLASLILLAGCGGGGPTEPPPPPPFKLTITGITQATPQIGQYPDGSPKYTCAVEMAATASGGEAGDYAEWENAELLWVRLSDGATSTQTWTFTDMVDYWGSSRVTTGSTVRTEDWSFWWSQPFRITFTFRYWVSQTSEYRADHRTFQCG